MPDQSSPAVPRWKKCGPNEMTGFAIVSAREGHPAGIYFRPCGVASHHPDDVTHTFCAYCHRFAREEISRLFHQERHRLPMITIYNQTTKDFPGLFVARLFFTNQPTAILMAHDDLEALRAMIPAGTDRLIRSPQDDPTIIETWL